jgi:hypothetical protein
MRRNKNAAKVTTSRQKCGQKKKNKQNGRFDLIAFPEVCDCSNRVDAALLQLVSRCDAPWPPFGATDRAGTQVVVPHVPQRSCTASGRIRVFCRVVCLSFVIVLLQLRAPDTAKLNALQTMVSSGALDQFGSRYCVVRGMYVAC